jgi:hypothetical protein
MHGIFVPEARKQKKLFNPGMKSELCYYDLIRSSGAELLLL